jgi:hypothetical protein
MRYPTPGVVVTTGGSPSLRRRRPMVTVTVLVEQVGLLVPRLFQQVLGGQEGRRGVQQRRADPGRRPRRRRSSGRAWPRPRPMTAALDIQATTGLLLRFRDA